MTKAHELVGISMFEFAGIYSRLDGYFICTAIVYIIAGCSLLTLLFVVKKKPIAAIVSDLLALLICLAQRWDYIDRGVVPSSNYEWGAAYYLFFVAVALVFFGSVWMLVVRVLNKRKQ